MIQLRLPSHREMFSPNATNARTEKRVELKLASSFSARPLFPRTGSKRTPGRRTASRVSLGIELVRHIRRLHRDCAMTGARIARERCPGIPHHPFVPNYPTGDPSPHSQDLMSGNWNLTTDEYRRANYSLVSSDCKRKRGLAGHALRSLREFVR